MNYYSAKINDSTILRLAPLSNAEADEIGFEGTASGYFLCRTKVSAPCSVEVLAHVSSDEAAFQLSLLLGLR